VVEPLPLERFPASARLRETSEFLAVRAEGRMVQGRWLRMSVLQRPTEDSPSPARVGIVTSRRVGGAVQRNRLRRRVREIFRARRGLLPDGIWLVVTAKPGSSVATFAELREEWLRLAKRLSILRDP